MKLNKAIRFLVMVAIAMTVVLVVALPALAMQDATAPAATTGVPLAARVLAVATVVFAVLQGVKQFFPSVGGIAAIAINAGLTFLGTVVAAPPGTEILSFTFLFSALAAALGAAGIHGTVKSSTAA